MISSQLFVAGSADSDDDSETNGSKIERLQRTLSQDDRQRLDRKRRGENIQQPDARIGDIWRNSVDAWLEVTDIPTDRTSEYTLQNSKGDTVRVHEKLLGGSKGKGAAAKQWQLIRMASSISQNADDSDGSTATVDENPEEDDDRATADRLNKEDMNSDTPAVRIDNVEKTRISRPDTERTKANAGANDTNSATENSSESDGDSSSTDDSDSSSDSDSDSDSSNDSDSDSDTETGSSSDSDSNGDNDSATGTLQEKSRVEPTADPKGYRERGVGVARRTGGADGGKMRGSKGRFKRKRGK